MKLCFATNNAHKLEEIRKAVGESFEIVSLKDIQCFDELPETQDTLEGNSLQKAQYVWEHFGVSCFADDTGLEVAALNGAPGVYSARYAGEHCSFQDNVDLLLSNMQGIADRKAKFRTVITIILNGEVHQFEGEVAGKITETASGKEGFGYDPIFLPDEKSVTFAEMSMEEKNTISHRGRATKKLVEFLHNLS